jgi:hypothetical protein
MSHSLFIHSLVDGRLSYFLFLDTVNSSAVNIGVQMFLQHTDVISEPQYGGSILFSIKVILTYFYCC